VPANGSQQQISERGGLLLITARFIPGGRTALTLSCGITRQRRLWFIRWVAVATIIWATYSALLGRIGGEAFRNDHTKAFLTAFGLAIGTNVVIEIARHVRKKRKAAAAAAAG
jgi:membrane-associated protein